MNKKQIRGIIICALFLVMTVVAIINVRIEFPNEYDKSKSPVQSTRETPKQVVSDEKADVSDYAKKEEESVLTKEETAPADTVEIKSEHICTIEIRCDTVADTSKLENPAVAPYVPEDGIILEAYEMEFTPGESVFDILYRATKEKNIHMEFRSDGVYGGKYIEGINYLYEMDAGPVSGWMYKVNGKFPNYGCASCEVKDGDAVVWLYTCDLGLDVGDNSVW